VIGVRTPSGIETRIGINGNAQEAPNSWPEWAQKAFVPGAGHAEAGILNSLADGEYIEFGGTSRNICWDCYMQLDSSDILFGGPDFPGAADKSPRRMFSREPGSTDGP
jgi:hypothetical protein